LPIHLEVLMPLSNAVASSALASLLLLAPCAQARPGPSSDVVYRLYKDYAWEALFEDSGKIAGKPLLLQPRQVLARYFDATLVRLLLKEQACLARHVGEVCNLDFNPIFASQDPGATGLKIASSTQAQVEVQFTYPSDRSTVRLVYRMVQTRSGWRIQDIRYPASERWLSALLAQ
jgi:hypothetical protein